MRITLDIQDQNLTQQTREGLLELLHEIELDPEPHAIKHAEAKRCDPPCTTEAELRKLLADARAARKTPEPISPTEFFREILKTKGFATKAEAHQHVQELRAEWDS